MERASEEEQKGLWEAPLIASKSTHMSTDLH